MRLLDYNIASSYPELSFKGKMIINTINPHSYCIAKNDSVFKTALKEADVLLPDGIGIVWAARVLEQCKIKKIAGYDIFIYLMEHLNSMQGSCFFLGASEETLELIRDRVKKDYPHVTIGTHSPPYKTEFGLADSKEMCDQVNNGNSQVLFVGMTAPKQEKWVHLNKQSLSPPIICSIGAVFDFYAGTVKRSHPFWIKLGLEWLPRFLKDPKRLAERNLVSTPKFIAEVLMHKFF